MKRSKKGLKRAAKHSPEYNLFLEAVGLMWLEAIKQEVDSWFKPRKHNRIDLQPHLNRYKPAKAKK